MNSTAPKAMPKAVDLIEQTQELGPRLRGDDVWRIRHAPGGRSSVAAAAHGYIEGGAPCLRLNASERVIRKDHSARISPELGPTDVRWHMHDKGMDIRMQPRRIEIPQALHEFLWFGLKEIRSCLFAGGFFAILALSKWLPLGDLPRYDFLLLAAIGLQALLLWLRLETWEEVRTISLFHLLGFALELFKTHPAIGSWSYPEAAYMKLFGVPLYAGFMYAAVASYMTQAWRQFELGLTGYPKSGVALPLALAIYANFFTHHFIGDWRWLLIAVLLWQFRHCRVHFTPKGWPEPLKTDATALPRRVQEMSRLAGDAAQARQSRPASRQGERHGLRHATGLTGLRDIMASALSDAGHPRRRYWMPMPAAFVLIGFFIWIAENIATFFGAWVYPDQHAGWQLVHWGKISSWSLLVVITFLIVAEAQRSRQRRLRERFAGESSPAACCAVLTTRALPAQQQRAPAKAV